MKITKIEKKEGIYFVTKVPDFIERLFGIKKRTERYKTNDEVFLHFNRLKIFYKSTGELLDWNDEMCKILNNYEHSF